MLPAVRLARQTSFQRSPACFASASMAGVMLRMPSRSTSCGLSGIPIRTVDNAATFMEASQPSISPDGSVSVIPMDAPYLTASSSVSPLSILSSNRLVQEFRMPVKPSSSAPGRVERCSEKIGAPSITVDSKRNCFPIFLASWVRSLNACTTGPLLAVTACIPFSSAACRWLIAGCPVS